MPFDLPTLETNAQNNLAFENVNLPIITGNVYDIKPELQHQEYIVPILRKDVMGKETEFTLPTLWDTGQKQLVQVQNITTANLRNIDVNSSTTQLFYDDGFDAQIVISPTRALSKAFPILLEHALKYKTISNVDYAGNAMKFLEQKYIKGIVAVEGLFMKFFDADLLQDISGQTVYTVVTEDNTTNPTPGTASFGFDSSITTAFNGSPIALDTFSKLQQALITAELSMVGWDIDIWVCKEVYNELWYEYTKSPNPSQLSRQIRLSRPEDMLRYQDIPSGSNEMMYIPIGEYIKVRLLPDHLAIFGFNTTTPGFQALVKLKPAYAGYTNLTTKLEMNISQGQPLDEIRDMYRRLAKTPSGSDVVTELVPTNGVNLLSKLIVYLNRVSLKVPARFNYAGPIQLSPIATASGNNYTAQMASLIATAQTNYNNAIGNRISNVQTRVALGKEEFTVNKNEFVVTEKDVKNLIM